MAAIIDDGPRVWVVDTLNHKLGRVLSAVSAAALLAQVHILTPGNARFALAVGAVILVVYACRPQPAGPAVTSEDLAEVENLVLDTQDRIDRHVDARFNEITVLVQEIRDQVRSR